MVCSIYLQTLVQQLEDCEDKLGNEAVQDTPASLEARESIEQDLKTELALCEKELLEKEKLIERLKAEQESLPTKVNSTIATKTLNYIQVILFIYFFWEEGG